MCPFNISRARPTAEPAFQPRESTTAPRLADLTKMTQDEFRQAFRRSPVKRAKRRGLMRNVAAALSSSGDPEAETALRTACDNPEPLVREQARLLLGLIQ